MAVQERLALQNRDLALVEEVGQEEAADRPFRLVVAEVEELVDRRPCLVLGKAVAEAEVRMGRYLMVE